MATALVHLDLDPNPDSPQAGTQLRPGHHQQCELPAAKHYAAPFVLQPPVIDGRPSAPHCGGTNKPADEDQGSVITSRTSNHSKPNAFPWVAWDDKFVYIGATLFDPFLSANVTERNQPKDQEFVDNTFEIFIDPDRTNQNYKRIQVNPLGIVRTAQYTKPETDGGKLSSWNLGPEFQVKVYTPEEVRIIHDPVQIMNSNPELSSFWSVEMAIPVASLRTSRKRAPSSQGPYSGFNFMRTGWPPKTVNNNNNNNDRRRRRRVNVELFEPRYQLVWNRGTKAFPGTIANPDSWGTNYFSQETHDACFKPDPQATLRYLLSKIYHAQWAYHNVHGYFASLPVPGAALTNCTSAPHPHISIDYAGAGFQASVSLDSVVGSIRQDRFISFNH
ncbi:hypothetical protein K493DRAFT_360762 [Basidiobolus meristosporus CBS 931.73]|uniref:Carbohydrate-binding domain-containing protein n=1 Tax=Basidiobolus meristosporus CBS 931.73 TaxID=1314790 RepID=A0A1Y1XEM3_9FUNG|nr:hypothetical protein K493DRAFT_360762 [Basidiobolus meristosporus CBS 931.73]|eukprot:ORX84208.1 hypothetical protein K493DRAFT_360762 [Basidiobolus meristosporus CBS 931.73]